MLSDEEKKAIEVLQYVKNKTPFIFWYEDKPYNRKETINTILNLIEKQQKEIEELKKDKLELINKNHVVHLKDVEKELREMRKAIDIKNAEIECLNVIHESYKEMVEENNFISKDKIKAKIEELDKMKSNGEYTILFNSDNVMEVIKAVLQSLLEEK